MSRFAPTRRFHVGETLRSRRNHRPACRLLRLRLCFPLPALRRYASCSLGVFSPKLSVRSLCYSYLYITVPACHLCSIFHVPRYPSCSVGGFHFGMSWLRSINFHTCFVPSFAHTPIRATTTSADFPPFVVTTCRLAASRLVGSPRVRTFPISSFRPSLHMNLPSKFWASGYLALLPGSHAL